ncbi:MAG: AAA family ATPase [Pseudomonadota bacterium]
MNQMGTISLDEADRRARAEAPAEDFEPLPFTRQPIKATPYVWTDPAALPSRQWLYGAHRLRKFVSVTFAPGGMGKSSLLLAEALAQATGRPLLGEYVHERGNVWLWNGEDPIDELHRRVAAACLAHRVSPQEIEGRLFLDSGRSTEMIVARKVRDELLVAEPVVEAIIGEVMANDIDTLIVDPFVLTHSVPENDNSAIDRVARQWALIANACCCSVELVHHVRKASQGQSEHTVEDGRGAVALLAAARSARVLNRMTKEEGETAGVENHRQFFRIDNGKANLAPPADKTTWHQIESVELPNGDNVGVVTSWKWPDPLADMTVGNLLDVQKAIDGKNYRRSPQSPEWIGNAIAEILGLDAEADRKRITRMIAVWLKSGALKEGTVVDKRNNVRPIIEVGEWANT